MKEQLALPMSPARAQGEAAGAKCLETAEKLTNFDADGARAFILAALDEGPMRSEALVDVAKAAGFRGHDDRCFGPVFGVLARRGLIRCVGYYMRAKGHGTAGGRAWEKV